MTKKKHQKTSIPGGRRQFSLKEIGQVTEINEEEDGLPAATDSFRQVPPERWGGREGGREGEGDREEDGVGKEKCSWARCERCKKEDCA